MCSSAQMAGKRSLFLKLWLEVQSLVAINMVSQLFREEPPYHDLKTMKANNSAALTDIFQYFCEIKRRIYVLDGKYQSKSRYKNV